MPRPQNAKASPAKVEKIQRTLTALELRRQGLGFKEIAEQLGVAVSTAHEDVTTALKEAREKQSLKSEDLIELELQRLDEMWNALWPNRANPKVATALVRVLDRKAKLLGLDAPKKVGVKSEVTFRPPVMFIPQPDDSESGETPPAHGEAGPAPGAGTE